MSGVAPTPTPGGASMRVDKWLWRARFFKTRTLAGEVAAGGRVRLNRRAIAKPGQAVRIGDVLTFPQGPRVRVIEILALAERRGPAAEAQTLYRDLDPPAARRADPDAPPAPAPAAKREPGAGRPTKRDRRRLDRLKPDPGEP